MTSLNMRAIQTVTVGAGGAGSIVFSNIPQTYTDLAIMLSSRSTNTATFAGVTIAFNGSSANYTLRWLGDASGGAVSYTQAAFGANHLVYIPGGAATANTFGNSMIYLTNYASSTANKSLIADGANENNAGPIYMGFSNGLWSQTSAITSLTLQTGNTFAQHTTATLYGITSAGVGAKATGGIITQDANYFYHTFLASGTFTPTQSLTADYLVVAGGGGGSDGGGGGAGGLRCTVTATGGGGSLESALSLTAQAYTVTVGAGGSAGPNNGTGTSGSNSVFSTITATGGGNGGNYAINNAGTGGSGGGAGYNSDGAGSGYPGGAGTTNQGYAGGSSSGVADGERYPGAGGGGAGAVGANITSQSGGNGGAGVATSITGSSVTYAGGGGGGVYSGGTPGNGGSGGGGNGGGDFSGGQTSTAGTANTGGGGGGGSSDINANAVPRAGGSGIVVIRYAK